jgi:multidrug efflux pump subunit AcrB
MLITTLLAIAGVYIGLFVTGTEFNITSRMGMTMIVGIVTEVAIFYYSEYQSLPEEASRYTQAGINRMRPIAMTTFASILALLPLVLVVLPALLALFRSRESDNQGDETVSKLSSWSLYHRNR